MCFSLTSPHYLSQYLIFLFLLSDVSIDSPQTSFTELLSMCINDLSPFFLSFTRGSNRCVAALWRVRKTLWRGCVCVGGWAAEEKGGWDPQHGTVWRLRGMNCAWIRVGEDWGKLALVAERTHWPRCRLWPGRWGWVGVRVRIRVGALHHSNLHQLADAICWPQASTAATVFSHLSQINLPFCMHF